MGRKLGKKLSYRLSMEKSKDLKGDDVSSIVANLLHDALLPIVPLKSPGGAVAVHLAGGILVTEHVVTHDCEDA